MANESVSIRIFVVMVDRVKVEDWRLGCEGWKSWGEIFT